MKLIKVKSFTDLNKEYTVRQLDSGEWRCDCPNFIFNERKIGSCNHIRKVRHLKLKKPKHGKS